MEDRRTLVTATILRLLAQAGPGRNVGADEVARALAGSDEKAWSRLMGAVREAAVALARAGEVVILRKGRPVDPESFKGVYRIASARGRPRDP